jgi:aspartate carbamoyltransferase catalytic subunit
MTRHLLDIASLSKDSVSLIFDRAKFFQQSFLSNTKLEPVFDHELMVNLFYEPSTRTQYSFDIAASRLGLKTINPDMQRLSDNKGESLQDTIATFEAMGARLIVLRHNENMLPHKLAPSYNTPIINAGDGTHQHPSQALIDLYTIQQHYKTLENLRISIIGDIAHSRVAHSLIDLLTLFNVERINLVGPEELLPTKTAAHISKHTDLTQGISECDVVIALRIQKERFNDQAPPSNTGYYKSYGLNTSSFHHAKETAIIMHPGPVNRGIEIDDILTDGPSSKIQQQIQNSIPVRMAIIEFLLSN